MKKLNGLQTAVPYCRVSDREQKKGLSLDSQRDTMRQFCVNNNISIIAEFSDVTSGTKFDRDGFNALKKFCEKKKPTYVLVWRWDRLGRNAVETLGTIKYFQKLGIEINSTEQWKEDDSADSQFMLGLQAILAERESKITSERTAASMRHGLENGAWMNKLPIGYVRSKILDERDKRAVEVCPNGSKIVQKVFGLFVGGMDKMKIRDYVLEQFAKELREINHKFPKIVIRRILTNSLYVAKLPIRNKKGEIERYANAKHPAIISQNDFDAAQNRLLELEGKHGQSGHQERDEYPLKGSFLCPNCFIPLRAYVVKKKLKNTTVQQTHYYDCKANHYRIQAKVAHSVTSEAMQEISISEKEKAQTLKHVHAKIEKMLSQTLESQKKITYICEELRGKLSKLDSLLLDGLSVENYERMSMQLRTELREKESELTAMGDFVRFREHIFKSVIDMMTDIGTGYDNAAGSVQKKIIKSVFPSGFFIDKENGIVLTPFLNSFVSLIHSESATYKKLRVIVSHEVTFCSPHVTKIEPLKPKIEHEAQLITDYICEKNKNINN